MERQTEILTGQLRAQGPIIDYHIHRVNIKQEPDDKSTLKNYKVSLVWKNFGKDIATDINYRQGHNWLPSLPDEVDRSEFNRVFSDKIFVLDGLPGNHFLSPEATVDTDQILLTPEELVALYKKEKSLMIWSVIRYGSRLEKETWFTEIAVWLEFVLDVNPLTHGFDGEKPNHTGFRVAVRGYRRRTADDERTQN